MADKLTVEQVKERVQYIRRTAYYDDDPEYATRLECKLYQDILKATSFSDIDTIAEMSKEALVTQTWSFKRILL